MIIAVDFDGTLCEHEFPEIGKPKQNVIDWVKKKQEEGAKIVLWTCRENMPGGYDFLDQAVAFCKKHGIFLSAVNENCASVSGFATRKILADIYLDDRALNERDLPK